MGEGRLYQDAGQIVPVCDRNKERHVMKTTRLPPTGIFEVRKEVCHQSEEIWWEKSRIPH